MCANFKCALQGICNLYDWTTKHTAWLFTPPGYSLAQLDKGYWYHESNTRMCTRACTHTNTHVHTLYKELHCFCFLLLVVGMWSNIWTIFATQHFFPVLVGLHEVRLRHSGCFSTWKKRFQTSLTSSNSPAAVHGSL